MRREAVKLSAHLNSGATTMQISIGTAQRVMGAVIFSAAELDGLMAGLGDIRSKMTPEVPQNFPQNEPRHQHAQGRYLYGLDPFSGVPILSFRSPAFGWLSFPLPEAELERMLYSIRGARARVVAPKTDKPQ